MSNDDFERTATRRLSAHTRLLIAFEVGTKRRNVTSAVEEELAPMLELSSDRLEFLVDGDHNGEEGCISLKLVVSVRIMLGVLRTGLGRAD